MKIGARNTSLQVDHTAVAEFIARRWKQNRLYITLNKDAPEVWLQAARWRLPSRSALQLHGSRRALLQTVFDGAV